MSAVVLCMKWGTLYGPDYVIRLRNMVGRWMKTPHRFVCLTDDPAGLPPTIETHPIPAVPQPEGKKSTNWHKLGMFKPDVAHPDIMGPKGTRCLFLDLDVVITGWLDPFLDFRPDKLGIPENWTQPGKGVGNSSVTIWTVGAFDYIYDFYVHELEKDITLSAWPNSQTIVSRGAASRDGMEYLPKEWVRSFKVDCMGPGILNRVVTPRLPEGARIVAFHGFPNPPDAIHGGWPVKVPFYKQLHKYCRPTPWVKQHWH